MNGIVLLIIAAIFGLWLFCNKNAIVLGAAIMEAAADFVGSNTRIAFVPIVQYIIMIPVFIWFIIGVICFATMGRTEYRDDSFVNKLYVSDNAGILILVFAFGIIWIFCFLVGF